MFKFYLSTLKLNSIGHLIYNPIRFFYLYQERKKIYILINRNEIVNKAAYDIIKNNYQSDKVVFIENKFFVYVFRKLIILSKNLKFLNYFINNIETFHNRHRSKKDWEEYFSKPLKKNGGFSASHFDKHSLINKQKIKISKFFFDYYKNWKKKNNIIHKHVLIFSRDEGYYKEQKIDPRNGNFAKLHSTIEFLTKQNIQVIRIGRNPYQKYYSNSDLFFDYSEKFKNNYDDIAEVMLFSDCKFLISNNSGIISIQWLFDNKIIIYDHFPIGYRPAFRNCVYIIKKLKNNNSYIQYKDVPKDLKLSEDIDDYSKNDICIEENSEMEILELVKNNFNNLNLEYKIDYNKFIVLDCGENTSYLCKKWYSKNKNTLFD